MVSYQRRFVRFQSEISSLLHFLYLFLNAHSRMHEILHFSKQLMNYAGLEYCQLESFEAQCSKSEVVMMTMAKYGRMRVGKCLSEKEASFSQEPEYLGCYRDVLKQMHERCSLEKECRMGIPNKELDKTRNCFPGLNLYLEAEYECLQGECCVLPLTPSQPISTCLSGGSRERLQREDQPSRQTPDLAVQRSLRAEQTALAHRGGQRSKNQNQSDFLDKRKHK